jgi:phosphoglycerol transferase MdoB-like AlkP superfamily enzyme
MNSTRWLPYRLLVIRLLIVFLIFTLSRVLFITLNPSTTSKNLINLFLSGIRFDAVAIAYLLAPIILIYLWPTQLFLKKAIQPIINVLYFIAIALSVLLNTIDTAWFQFTGKRTTFSIIKLLAGGDDINNNILHYFLDFWHLIVMMLLLIGFSVFAYKKSSQKFSKNILQNYQPFKLPVRLLFLIIGCGLWIIGARGGLQYKPINMQDAALYVEASSIPAVLNTPFTVMKSLGKSSFPSNTYMSEKEALALFNMHHEYESDSAFTNENVVLIILESFSSEYIGCLNHSIGYTPFLDSLSSQGLLCTRALANSRRSIEGIPSIVTSIPHLMEDAFISSPYNINKVNSIASALKTKGYKNYFFHGGNNGTMGFDGFCKVAGFDSYLGRNEYDGPKTDFDGFWGIFDDKFYSFAVRKLNKTKTPFSCTFFSLSSHDPYEIPTHLKGKFNKGTRPIHESIGYADYSLKQFFEAAKFQPWYENTLFVITADHTGPTNDPFYSNRFGQLQIPILYFRPDNSLKAISTTVTQQTDIVPTILDLLNYSGKYSSIGQSLFSKNQHWNISYSNGIWQLINEQYLVQYNGEKVSALYNIEVDSLLQKNQITFSPSKVNELKPLVESILQQYREGLQNNTLTSP